MAWIWIALLLVSTAGAGLADTITCYNCNGTVEQAGTAGTACGWYKGWTSSNLDKRTGVICPDGICYTLMIGGTGQVATIYRGCGQVTCDKLPRGWEKQEAVCDSATNKVKPPPANEKLNDIRLFQASLPGNVSVTNLQYCDTDWCGTGGEQIVQRYTTALAAAAAPPATPAPPPPPAVVPVVVPPPTNVVTTNNVAGTGDQAGTSNQPANGAVVVPVITNGGGQTPAPVDTSKVAAGNAVSAGAVSTGTDNNQPAAGGVVIRPGTMLNSCLQCRSQANDICGLRGSDLLGSVRTVNCNAGFCFIFVRAEAGQPAMVTRGCGPLPCSLIPGANGDSRLCDEYGRVPPIDANNGLFNQTRSYYVPFGPGQGLQAGTLQYCDSGSNCNSGSIINFPLKNYYYLVGSTASRLPGYSLFAMGTAIILAVIG